MMLHDYNCEIEFAQIPCKIFCVNAEKLGIAKPSLIVNPPTSSSSSSVPSRQEIIRLRYYEIINFPGSLILAFRVDVENNCFDLNENQGLMRLIECGFKVLMDGLKPDTELRSILAAVAIHQLLGLTTQVGEEAKSRAKSIAKESLDDVLLIRDCFRQIKGVPEEVDDKLSAALTKLAKLERENQKLTKALEQAYGRN